MFNSNQTVMEVRLCGDPERSDRADVTKCNACMFQGKKEDDIKPIWVTLQGWKYQARVLEGLQKGRQLVVGGNLKQDTWTGNDGVEKTRLILTAEWMAEKLWADSGQQGGGGGQGGYNPNSQQGGQGGGYQQGGYPEQNQAGHQRQVHGGYQQSQNSQQQTQNQGVYQQQGGGQGENYPQPPDDDIPF